MSSMVISLFLAMFAAGAPQQGAEKPVDKNSVRVTVPGCLSGHAFTVIERSATEPVEIQVDPGKVFRLNVPKDVMKELSRHNKATVELTGIIRKSALQDTRGMPVDAGGRVRVGGMPPNQDPSRMSASQPMGYVDVFDVESFRPINESCPSK